MKLISRLRAILITLIEVTTELTDVVVALLRLK